MIWLSVICFVFFSATVFLSVRIILIKKDISAINKEFAEKLKSDTNTLLTVSGCDKSVRKLAADMNVQLRVLRERRLKYEHGDSELKNTVASISHDLRTPLTAIGGYLELLENERKSKNAERYVGIIKNRTEILKQLSEELFCCFVIASPDSASPKEKLSLNAVLEESIAEHYSSLRQAGITPEINMPDKTVYGTVNRVALSRVFSNLISNAIKYSDGDFCITLRDSGEIVFSNTARDLTEVQIKRLFDRFYTVESIRKSTGLGLSIAKALVEQMNGTIEAEYEKSKLTITVRLPSVD